MDGQNKHVRTNIPNKIYIEKVDFNISGNILNISMPYLVIGHWLMACTEDHMEYYICSAKTVTPFWLACKLYKHVNAHKFTIRRLSQ